MSMSDDNRQLVLRSELAALLHDVGKFSKGFAAEAVGSEQGLKALHTTRFLDEYCQAGLRAALEQCFPKTLALPDGKVPLLQLGDLLRLHHDGGDGIMAHYDLQPDAALPLLPLLMMIADSLDSASSKGGAVFKAKKRSSRLDHADLRQAPGSILLATPFGEVEARIDLDRLEAESVSFQIKLAGLLAGFADWDLGCLVARRGEIQAFMRDSLSKQLAETRLPNNDVSLWQHSFSTAAIFKAMLVGRMLRGEFDPPVERGELASHRERLALLAVRWNQDEFLSKSFRAKEMLGLRLELDSAAQAARESVEITACLGNEVYRDRDGVCFLVPAARPGTDAVREELRRLAMELGRIVEEKTHGELEWEVRYKDVGLQILGLASLIGKESPENVEILAQGPTRPGWTGSWAGGSDVEACPRCGVRPVELSPVTVGSEADQPGTKGDTGQKSVRICSVCSKRAEDGSDLRKMLFDSRASTDEVDAVERLIGIRKGEYWRFDLGKLRSEENDPAGKGNRLALVQGVLDLRGVLSGEAFSSVLAANPGCFSVAPGAADESGPMDTWESMLAEAGDAWTALKKGASDNRYFHSLQQIFQDTRLGIMKDGRAEGAEVWEKALNYLKNVVLAAPFPETLGDEAGRMVNYALRQHPAPSRLARAWETTARFAAFPMTWCEERQMPYSPLSRDPGSFQILVEARHAWKLVKDMQVEYEKNFARVRAQLPFHLSVTVFYHKAPLYIAIDAARRFARLGLDLSRAPKCWTFAGKREAEDGLIVRWQDHRGRPVDWRIPKRMPGGRKDTFYSWFWPAGQGNRHPVRLEDLRENDQVLVRPSTFDYEILDATTRRYDIRIDDTKLQARPHYMLGGRSGPRPYPLEVLDLWMAVDEPLKTDVEQHQRKMLVEALAWVHQAWGLEKYKGEIEAQATTAIELAMGKDLLAAHREDLQRMAVEGSLFDLMEWQDFISDSTDKRDNRSAGGKA